MNERQRNESGASSGSVILERTAALLNAIDVAHDKVFEHGASALSYISNVRRIAEELKAAVQNTVVCGAGPTASAPPNGYPGDRT